MSTTSLPFPRRELRSLLAEYERLDREIEDLAATCSAHITSVKYAADADEVDFYRAQFGELFPEAQKAGKDIFGLQQQLLR